MIQEKVDFAVWDIGGINIFRGEQNGEYFATGSEFGYKLFLKNLPVRGLIWVVNIS